MKKKIVATTKTNENIETKTQIEVLGYKKLLLKMVSGHFRNKEEQLDYALHELLKFSGSEFGYICFYNEEREEFVLNSWTEGVMRECTVEDKPKVYKLEDTGIWGEVVRQRKPIIINDYKKPTHLKKGYPKGHVELDKFMSIPVIVDNEIVAVVGLANKKDDYDESDIYEITALMSGVWNSIQRRETMEELIYERNKYYQTLLSIRDGVIVVDRNKKIEFMNPEASRLTDWSLKEAIGKDYREILILSHEQKENVFDDPIDEVFRTELPSGLRDCKILTSKIGKKYYIEDNTSPIMDEKGKLEGIVFVFRDITEKREHMKKIEYMSFRDPLTGLYNRRFFEEELRRLDTPRNLPISIVVGDINSLKLVNDIFGHTFGDMLLKKVAKTMKRVCRADDIIARWAGDEFVLLLPRTDSLEARKIVERIKKGISKQQVCTIKCSIAIDYDTKSEINEDIIRTLDNAEAKMYSVKTLERDTIRHCGLTDIIETLYRSERERKHAIYVSNMCRKFGTILDLPKQEVKKLSEAGRLHNIGKIALDAHSFREDNRKGQLEREKVEQHPIVGYRILSFFDETKELADVVLAHHENWDGTGYPKGLKGKDIPLFARIISVVDAYYTMLLHNNGDKSKNQKLALQKIKEQSGKKFDPKIVEVLIKALNKENTM